VLGDIANGDGHSFLRCFVQNGPSQGRPAIIA